jgi:hypothetical protein
MHYLQQISFRGTGVSCRLATVPGTTISLRERPKMTRWPQFLEQKSLWEQQSCLWQGIHIGRMKKFKKVARHLHIFMNIDSEGFLPARPGFFLSCFKMKLN